MHSSAFNATRLALAPLLISMCMCILHLKACSLIGKGLLYEKLPQFRLRYGVLTALRWGGKRAFACKFCTTEPCWCSAASTGLIWMAFTGWHHQSSNGQRQFCILPLAASRAKPKLTHSWVIFFDTVSLSIDREEMQQMDSILIDVVTMGVSRWLRILLVSFHTRRSSHLMGKEVYFLGLARALASVMAWLL